MTITILYLNHVFKEHSFLHTLWHSYLTFLSDIPIWHSYLTFLSDIPILILSGIVSDILSILSGILSGTLSDMYSDILSGIYSDICSFFFWHLFGSRRGSQHPELTIWLRSIGAHTTDEMAKEETRRRGGKKKKKELHLCQNLETLTWQVGKNKTDATLQQEFITAHQPFLRSKPNSLLWQYHQEATSVSAAPATPIRALAESFSLTFLKHTLRSPAGCSPALISVQSFPFPETSMSFQLLLLTLLTLKKSSEKPQNGLQWKAGKLCKSILVFFNVWYASSCIP